MNQTFKMETARETIEHMKFQLDLIKLTSMPVELTAPSVMQTTKREDEAIEAMQELKSTVEKLHRS